MTLQDKTGAPVVITRRGGDFAIEVEGKPVGLTAFADRNGQRIFYHTEVDDAFGGRGLGTLVIAEALTATHADGLRIVPVCPMVRAYVDKHPEYAGDVDAPTREVFAFLRATYPDAPGA
jgi:uncharacterized protein